MKIGGGEHDLSWPGFLLLVEAAKGLDRIPLPIRKVDVRTGFLRIAAYAARQVEPIESLSINEVNCESSSEGQACVGLLQIVYYLPFADLPHSFWRICPIVLTTLPHSFDHFAP